MPAVTLRIRLGLKTGVTRGSYAAYLDNTYPVSGRQPPRTIAT